MIDRQGGRILSECDSCEEVLDSGADDFDTARLMMRREGWSARKIAGEWLHGCPRCGVPS